jgi:hypothetical protein
MKLILVLSAALLLQLPQLSANILKDFVGNWNYVEKGFYENSSHAEGEMGEGHEHEELTPYTLRYTVNIRKLKNGNYHSTAREKTSSGLAWEEILRPNRTAVLKYYDSGTGKVAIQYTGTWSVRNGRLNYKYTSRDSSGVQKIQGFSKRVSAKKWTGEGKFTGGTYSITMTRRR